MKKQAELKQAEDKIEAFKTETEKASGENAGLVKELQTLSEEISSYQLKKSTAESSVHEIEERLKGTGSMLEERNRVIENLLTELETGKNNCENLENLISSLENQIKGYSIKVETGKEKQEKTGTKGIFEKDPLKRIEILNLIKNN